MSEVIPHWLTKQSSLSPDIPAIELENGEVITFLDLKQQSQSFAKKLANKGVKKGDHIGILSTNDVNMIILIHALSYLGAVGVLLNIRLTASELQFQMDDAEVSLLLYHEQLKEKGLSLQIKERYSFKELTAIEEKEIPLKQEIKLDDPFTIIYTSGTTGFPKGVIHTYGNHWWSAIGSALNLGLSKQDKWLAVLPFFHVGGLSIFFKSVIYGMPVYLVDKFEPNQVNMAIQHKGVTIVSVVTVMLKRLIESLGTEKYPKAFRGMLLGGGPAPESLLEKAKQKEIPVFQSYGMTETSSQIVTLSPYDALRKIGSSGKPLVPAQLKISQPQADGVGEIHVKGPMVTKAYYRNEEANTKAFDDGWLRTGDLGFIDEEGFLYVVDRRNDLIISGGENIYPTEIENVLSELPEINEVAIVGKPDSDWGEVPVAFIVKRENYLSEDRVIEFAKQRLAKYKVPKQVYFINELPRNASKKIVRSKLKQEF